MVVRSTKIWLNPVRKIWLDPVRSHKIEEDVVRSYSSEDSLRLGSFVLYRSPKEIMDHVTNALVEFIKIDSRRESRVHCCTENHHMVWVGPITLLSTSWASLRLVIVNFVLCHHITVAHHTDIALSGEEWVGCPLGFSALGSGVGLGWEICVLFQKSSQRNFENRVTVRQRRHITVLPYTTSGIHRQNKHDRHTDSRLRLLEDNSPRDGRGS